MPVLTVKRGGGVQDGIFGTIEGALSAAVEGDTIELSPGRYEEVISITVPGITIRALEYQKAIICSRKGEHNLSVVTIEAYDVTISGIDIKCPGSAKQSSHEAIPAVLILAPDVEVIGCKISGRCSIGVKTYEMNTKVTTCEVTVGNTAILAMEQSAGIRIDRCRLRSTHDTGIWLLGASKSNIIETAIENCGHTGVWLDSAPVVLKDVTITASKNNGIVFDWPESTPISASDYIYLSRLGHCLENVTVTKCKKNGIYVFPGVRVLCTDCTFSNNGDAGAFFEGPEDENKEKEEVRRQRVKTSDVSIIHESNIQSNSGFGVESEEIGLVELTGHSEFARNKKGDMNGNVVSSAKRARSVAVAVSSTTSAPSGDQEISIISTRSTRKANQPTVSAPKSSKCKSTISHVDPITQVTQRSGVTLPKNWPPSRYFVGDINVNGWPGPDKLQEFFLTNSVKVNKKVLIDVSPENRGLGLLAAQTLRKGQVVGYYSGHLRKQQVKHDSEYVANWRPVGEKVDGEYEIDAEWGGNEMRFANYPNEDEEPNMKANCIRRNNLQVIAFKAIVDIKKGTELLWDYGPDYFEADEE